MTDTPPPTPMTEPPPTPMTEQLAWLRTQEEKTHRNRRRTNRLVTLFCLATLGVVGWSHIDEAKVLKIAQQATSPHQQKAANAFGDRIIRCDENHADRRDALERGVPVPPLAKGCPPDSISR